MPGQKTTVAAQTNSYQDILSSTGMSLDGMGNGGSGTWESVCGTGLFSDDDWPTAIHL